MRVKELARREPMVRWFSPKQLINTAAQVLLSLIFGSRADYRIIEALQTPQPKPFDYSGEKDLWLDFVADLGDGWNSTYSVASLLARPSLKLKDYNLELPRAKVLIMGGDEVYPLASRFNYENRLRHPYQAASNPAAVTTFADLFAIPGNHDWYDGLISFMRIFAERRSIGAWQTRQERSYFALKLPHEWWLLGVDIQLEADIDGPQLQYFRDAAGNMKAGDRVILCTAQPDWYYGKAYDPLLENNIDFLENKVIAPTGARILVRLSGDMHFYMRHEALDHSGAQMIISGGGGAFLKPTSGPNMDKISYRESSGNINFVRKAEYPDAFRSWLLGFKILLFPFYNPLFGIFTAFAYLPVVWLSLKTEYSGNLFASFSGAFLKLLQTAGGFSWAAVMILLFIVFTDTHKKIYRWVAGFFHAVSHIFAALGIALFIFPLISFGVWSYWIRLFATLTGGYVFGSFVMGLYLFISLNVFRRHSDEAFSALRIQDYKNFLRLHFMEDGSLGVYPIAIEKVPRKWRTNPAAAPFEPLWLPDGAPLHAHLIENPIIVK